MTTTTEAPTLPAYRTRDGIHVMVWCKHCQKWHSHGGCDGTCNPNKRTRQGSLPAGVQCTCPVGTGNGHRVEHCHCDCSPYVDTGYTLQETGEWFEDQQDPPKISIEKKVRGLTKAERRTHLRDHGWYRLAAGPTETWFAPGWTSDPRGVVDPPKRDRGFYSLAAAIRKALSDDAGIHYPRWRA